MGGGVDYGVQNWGGYRYQGEEWGVWMLTPKSGGAHLWLKVTWFCTPRFRLFLAPSHSRILCLCVYGLVVYHMEIHTLSALSIKTVGGYFIFNSIVALAYYWPTPHRPTELYCKILFLHRPLSLQPPTTAVHYEIASGHRDFSSTFF